jgi:hypothetical protein
MVCLNCIPRSRLSGFSSIITALRVVGIKAVVGCSLVWAASVQAQAPPVLWRTNVNAMLFAIDSQTNVYANTNGSVITLNSFGVPFKTNSFCPVPSIAPGFALRDFSGNFYFAGNFDGTNDFGGKVIVGGWTNATPTSGKWQPGYPTCYLAKYSPNGALLWATRIDGLLAGSNVVTDLIMNPDSSVTVGLYAGLNFSQIAQFASTGTNLWQSANIGSFFNCGPVKLASLRGTNGGFLLYNFGQLRVSTGHYSSSGSIGFNSSQALFFTSSLSTSGKPVTTPAGEIYTAGLAPPGPGSPVLQKAVIGGGILWTQAIAGAEEWIVNSDNRGNLYVSGTDGSFSEYNSEGSQIWTSNYSSPAVLGLSDNTGNRIVQFADNTIALISADPGAQAPRLHLNQPAGDGVTPAGFQFSLSGESGSLYEIIWSTNLTSWQSMGFVTNASGDVQIVDPDATNQWRKFYRVAP